MPVDLRRYSRQVRLPEIGEAGQAKLCAAQVELRTTGFARTIEERYLRAAGALPHDRAEAGAGRAAPDVARLRLRHAAAVEVAAGALAALVAMRALLGQDVS